MQPLANAHFAEVDGLVHAGRRFALDTTVMQALGNAGVLRTYTARQDGRLIGYYTWNVTQDVESRGLLIAQQGAWYVEAGHVGVAAALFDFALAELRRLGVQCAYPHHRSAGRGAGIGRFFRRRGAILIQHTYSLWLGP